tara:strand:+ start:700 stop:1188 length:489 start_codon:yes stop_codon:yes gene_type:complete
LLSLFTKAVEDADVDTSLELFHGDATYDDVFDGVFTGRAQIRNMFEVNFHGRARDFRWEIHEPVSDGTIGYAHLTLSYTSRFVSRDGWESSVTPPKPSRCFHHSGCRFHRDGQQCSQKRYGGCSYEWNLKRSGSLPHPSRKWWPKELSGSESERNSAKRRYE